ncbi:hypothetical protein ACIQKE_27250 [Streptomyces griseoviridis]
MSAENGRARNGVVLGAATDCPCATGPDGEDGPPPVRRVDRTDSRERAVLMRAFSDSNSRLTEGQRELGAAGGAVVRSAQRVERGIRTIDRFRLADRQRPLVHLADAIGILSARREEAETAAGTTALRRPRVALMWRRLVWPVTVASAVFDAAFVGSVVQEILNVDVDRLQYWLAYLPGLAIGVCLLAAGTFLAHRLAGVRETRAGGAGDGTGRRGDDGFWRRSRPLVLPLLSVVAILGLIATCGMVRVRIAVADGDSYLALYQPVIVVLLLFLGIAAVAAKVLSHDPEAAGDAALANVTRVAEKRLAKRTKKAEKALDQRMRAVDDLAEGARGALVAHATAWFALKTAVDAAEQAARRQVEDASTGLVEERARTGTAGVFDFPLRSASWPLERNPRNGTGPGRGGLVQLDPPGRLEIRLDLLDEFRKVLDNHHPDGLARRLKEALDLLDLEWGTGEGPDDRPRGAEATPPPRRRPDEEAGG